MTKIEQVNLLKKLYLETKRVRRGKVPAELVGIVAI
jgi:hypothetical protein